jgi:hypothetical protein
MLTLKEIFDDLAYGELASMAMGNATSGGLMAKEYPRIVSLINAGLLDLYTRFPFRLKEFQLHQRAGKRYYYLRPEHTGSLDSTGVATFDGDTLTFDGEEIYLSGFTDISPEIYIDSTVERTLENDILSITRAFKEDGTPMHINDRKYPEEVFMPELDIVSILPTVDFSTMTFHYQAAHPKIVLTEAFDPSAYMMYFPLSIKRALTLFVAAGVFSGKASSIVEGQVNLSNTYGYRYEAEIVRIRNLSLSQVMTEEPTQFESNGWA